jgi:hypothetical protein
MIGVRLAPGLFTSGSRSSHASDPSIAHFPDRALLIEINH